MENLEQTRRSFIKTAGIALGGAALVGLAGCSPAATASNDSASAVTDISWDEEYDVLVIGAGLAGMASALTVGLEGDGATCLLIEKGALELGSGNSSFSSGQVLWTTDVDGFFEYMKELRDEMDNTPDDVLRAYAEGVGENLDWLRALPGWEEENANYLKCFESGTGSSCYPEYGELPHAYSLGRVNTGKFENKDLAHVQKLVYSVMKDQEAITYKTSAPLTALVQDPETKEIVGGVYESSNKSVYVKANKGVIMCCGGFENNALMRGDYLSGTTARPVASQLNEGDGVAIALKVGADMWHMNSCAGFWTSLSPIEGTTVTMRTAKESGITVATNGRRFYMDWDGDVKVDWENMDTGDLTTHVGSRHGHMQFGGEWPHLPMPKTTWFICDSTAYDKMVNGDRPLAFDPMTDGYGFSADTIEDLAAKIEVPADELATTVSQWNECCTSGNDIYFHRPPETLTSITTPPFYGLHCSATILNTDGGPRRSPKGEVVDLEGSPIGRLYTAGEFGSIWSHMYNGGGNLGECLAFGRISTRNALGIAR